MTPSKTTLSKFDGASFLRIGPAPADLIQPPLEFSPNSVSLRVVDRNLYNAIHEHFKLELSGDMPLFCLIHDDTSRGASHRRIIMVLHDQDLPVCQAVLAKQLVDSSNHTLHIAAKEELAPEQRGFLSSCIGRMFSLCQPSMRCRNTISTFVWQHFAMGQPFECETEATPLQRRTIDFSIRDTLFDFDFFRRIVQVNIPSICVDEVLLDGKDIRLPEQPPNQSQGSE